MSQDNGLLLQLQPIPRSIAAKSIVKHNDNALIVLIAAAPAGWLALSGLGLGRFLFSWSPEKEVTVVQKGAGESLALR